ncbi:hypothetical protein BH11PLA2_BH11PLA2_52920 [soil metagenome]
MLTSLLVCYISTFFGSNATISFYQNEKQSTKQYMEEKLKEAHEICKRIDAELVALRVYLKNLDKDIADLEKRIENLKKPTNP